MKPAAVVSALIAGVLVLGCGKTTHQPSTGRAAPASEATAAPSVQPPSPAGATPTPLGQSIRPAAIATSLQASCDVSSARAQIRVNFAATVQGGGNLTRVRLLDNGSVVHDSGPINQPAYRQIATFKVRYGERHTYQLVTDAPGGTLNAANVSSSIECAAPALPPGPRL